MTETERQKLISMARQSRIDQGLTPLISDPVTLGELLNDVLGPPHRRRQPINIEEILSPDRRPYNDVVKVHAQS